MLIEEKSIYGPLIDHHHIYRATVGANKKQRIKKKAGNKKQGIPKQWEDRRKQMRLSANEEIWG